MAPQVDSRGRGTANGVRLTLALLVAALVISGCGVFGGDDDGGETTTTTTATETTSETAEGEPVTDEEAAAEAEATGTEAGDVAAENEVATADEAAAAEGVVTTTVDPVTGETITSTTAATTPETVTTTVRDPASGELITTTTTATTTAETTVSPDGAIIIAPPRETATSVAPVREGSVTNVQSGLSMIPGLGARAAFPRFFSPGSPWNTDVSREAVDPDSDEMIAQARTRIAVEEINGRSVRVEKKLKEEGLTVNTTRWTVPLFSEQGGTPTVAVCRQVDCGPDAVDEIRIPPDARPDPRFDGWMTVINTQTREALDFWRARREQDGSISYHFVKAWDLNGPGFQEPGGVSARGSGLPLFAGLIRPEEIDRGKIDHALAIAVPGAAKERFVQPASRTDGVGKRTSIPEGARLRLRFRNTDDYINRVCPPGERRRNFEKVEKEARARHKQLTRDQNRELKPKTRKEARELARARDRILEQDLARAARQPCGLARSPEAQLTRTFVRNGVHRRTAQILIEALKHYGAIVVERSASPTLYAQRNARWKKVLPINVIQDIKLRNFEVLELPRVLNDPGSFTEIDPFTGLPTAAPTSIPGTAAGVDTTPETTSATTTSETTSGTTTAPTTTTTTTTP